MSDTQRKEQLLAAERAAEWLQRLEKGGPDVRAEFARWLRASPQHVRDILLANAFQHALRHMRAHHRVDVEALKNRCAFSVIAIGSSKVASRHGTGVCFLRRIVRGMFTAGSRGAWPRAAAVALIAIVSLMVVTIQAVSDHSIVTGAGEWRNVRLEDGTLLRAGPRTRVSVEMTGQQRLLHLAHGKIMVYVAKDLARPLYVETELATARAVGTAFAVRRGDDRDVSVTVQEGTVAVARGPAPYASDSQAPAREAVVLAGEGVAVRADAEPLVTRSVDLNRELAWIDDKLIPAEHSSVAKVIREFNLNNHTQIRLLDPKLGERQLRGVLQLSDPMSLARILEQQFPVSIVEDRGTLLVVPRPGATEPR